MSEGCCETFIYLDQNKDMDPLFPHNDDDIKSSPEQKLKVTP